MTTYPPQNSWINQICNSDVTVLTRAHRTTINPEDYEWRTEIICGSDVFSIDCWEQDEALAEKGHSWAVNRAKIFVSAAKRTADQNERDGLRILTYCSKPHKEYTIVVYEHIGKTIFNCNGVGLDKDKV